MAMMMADIASIIYQYKQKQLCKGFLPSPSSVLLKATFCRSSRRLGMRILSAGELPYQERDILAAYWPIGWSTEMCLKFSSCSHSFAVS